MAYLKSRILDLPPETETDECAQRRVMLIEALRDKSKWPAGFQWNFARCHTCGIGLYCRAFERRAPGDAVDEFAMIGAVLDLSSEAMGYVFDFPSYGVRSRTANRVTPEMVADRLEQVHREISAARV